MPELLSLNEAAAQGITRLRRPVWSDPFDHISIDIIGGKPGPWVQLWSPFNLACNGRDPVGILWAHRWSLSPDEKAFVPYTGHEPNTPEYRAEVDKWRKT